MRIMMPHEGIEYIRDGEDILAVVIRSGFSEPGLHFVTPGEYNLQLGVHVRPAGHVIAPHVHKIIEQPLDLPIQEYLYIEKGRVRIDFYDRNENFHSSSEFGPGDSVLLLMGHSMEFLEDVKIIEIKQGPYQNTEKDKRPIKGRPGR